MRRALVAAACAVLALGGLAGCDPNPARPPARKAVDPPRTPVSAESATAAGMQSAGGESSSPSAGESAAEPAPLADLTLPTISTYERVCARCHGPQGMFHWAQVGAFEPAQMPLKIRQMMTQQGQLKPEPADEAAMLAYHQAMHNVGPGGPLFIVALNAAAFVSGSAPQLTGEVTAGAEVTLVTPDGARQPVAVEDIAWTLPPGTHAPFEIHATLDGKTATLSFPNAAWAY